MFTPELGVRPLINGRGTWTYLCGSLELPEARRAAEEASHYFVDLFELQAGVGRHLAKLAGAESGNGHVRLSRGDGFGDCGLHCRDRPKKCLAIARHNRLEE